MKYVTTFRQPSPGTENNHLNINAGNEIMDKHDGVRLLEERLRNEMAEWQGKIDEVKQLMQQGTNNTQDAMRPYIEHMESELEQANEYCHKFESASVSKRQEIHTVISISFKFIRHSFDKAVQHFHSGENTQ